MSVDDKEIKCSFCGREDEKMFSSLRSDISENDDLNTEVHICSYCVMNFYERDKSELSCCLCEGKEYKNKPEELLAVTPTRHRICVSCLLRTFMDVIPGLDGNSDECNFYKHFSLDQSLAKLPLRVLFAFSSEPFENLNYLEMIKAITQITKKLRMVHEASEKLSASKES